MRQARKWILWGILAGAFFNAMWRYINRKRPFVPMNVLPSMSASWDSTYPGYQPPGNSPHLDDYVILTANH